MTATAAEPWVGRAIKRKEDPRLIMGRARYIDDLNVTGQLWAAFVRSPEAHAKIVSIDTSAAKAYRRRARRLHRPRPRPGGAAADGVGAAGDRRQQPAALGDRQGRGPLRRRPGRARHRLRPLRGRRRRPDVVVDYDPLPVVTDIEKALEDGRRSRPRRAGHEQVPRVVAGRRRPRGRLRRGRRDRRAPRGQPPHGGRGDRAARRARRLPRGQPHAHLEHPGPALPAALPRAPAGDQRGAHPGDRARGRRRLRLQAADLRRGDRAGVGVTQARAADQVGRVALRGHDGDPSRARPGRLRARRRHEGRQDHRLPHEDPRRTSAPT